MLLFLLYSLAHLQLLYIEKACSAVLVAGVLQNTRIRVLLQQVHYMSVVGEEIVPRNFTCCLKSNCTSVSLQKEDLSARSNDLVLAVSCG